MRMISFLSVFTLIIASYAPLQAETHALNGLSQCSKQALIYSVETASKKLRNMKAAYQANLKKELEILKQLKGWTNREFLLNVNNLIDNEKLRMFDTQNKNYIFSINSLNTTSKNITNDCEILEKLNDRLQSIIENTDKKWNFMLSQIRTTTRYNK